MAIVFITIMLLSVSLLGRLTNALLFAKILKAQQTRTLQWIALDYTTGCSVLIILAQLLLALGKYTPQLAFGGLVLLIFIEVTLLIYKEKTEYLGISYQYLLAIIFLGLATTLISVHHPGFWDDTSYHLIVSRDLARNGDLTPNLFLRYPFSPFNVDILFSLCFFATDFNPDTSVYYCQALANAPLFFIILLLAASIQQFTRSLSCLLIGLTLFVALRKTSVTVHTGYAYVDYAAALFTFSAFYYLMVIRHHRHLFLYIFLGLLLGITAGCKYQAAAVAAIITGGAVTYFLIHRMIKQTICLILSCAVFGSFWYIRNYIQDGNPVDPFLIDIFGSNVWDAEDFASNTSDIRFDHPRGFTAIVHHFLWSLVFVWLLVAARWAYLIFKYRSITASEIKLSDYISLGLTVYSMLWLEFFPIPRYLVPVIGILILYAVVISSRYFRKISPLIVIPFLILALVCRLTEPTRDHWANSKKQRELFITASKLSLPSDRLLTIDVAERNKYFYDGVTVGDLYGNARFSQFYQVGTEKLLPPEEFLDKMKFFKTRRAVISSRVLDESRINEYRSLFHFISSSPGKRGGYLIEPLAQVITCKWLPPHSQWMEATETGGSSDLKSDLTLLLNLSGRGINTDGCSRNKTSRYFNISLNFAELADWERLDGTLVIKDDLGNVLFTADTGEIPVSYDETGHRIRTIRIEGIPKFELQDMKHLSLEMSGSGGQTIGYLYSEAMFIEPADMKTEDGDSSL